MWTLPSEPTVACDVSRFPPYDIFQDSPSSPSLCVLSEDTDEREVMGEGAQPPDSSLRRGAPSHHLYHILGEPKKAGEKEVSYHH